jgi:ABC-type branched-subunit amino acid transport system ATPase component
MRPTAGAGTRVRYVPQGLWLPPSEWGGVMAVLLEVANLNAGYGPLTVLHGVAFSVEEGGITSLLGANGAGKTTTLRAVCGMIRPKGTITLGGESIAGRATEDIVRRGGEPAHRCLHAP